MNKTLQTMVFWFCFGSCLVSCAVWTARESLPAASISAGKTLPLACQRGCEVPFGQPVGSTPNSVVAYSNCNADCVVLRAHHWQGTYTGIEWQCVEYARRWLLTQMGMVYGDIDIAADLWNKITHLTEISSGVKVTLQNIENGAQTLPQTGDLLVYAREYLGTGHVAVVLKVDEEAALIQVAEQNYANQNWSNHYARAIPYTWQSNRVWVLDPFLVGWKRVMQRP